MPTWLGFCWTAPNTILGLIVGLFTFQTPRIDGAIIFDATPRGLTKLMPRFHRTAMTVGFVIVSAAPVTGQLAVHERHHIKQYCVLGPLFIPVYFALAIPYGYKRHPMELSAMRAAGEIETRPSSSERPGGGRSTTGDP
jgi:hypothetical protein